MKDSIVKEKSYKFALEIIRFYQSLIKKREYVISRQLLKAGTSIGANVEEALAGQSRRDFLAKMSIASKEARECNYWLRLILDSGIAEGNQVNQLIEGSEELIRILTSIVKSTSTKNSKLRTQNLD